MTKKVFSQAKVSFKGSTVTHWTTENMQHCSYIQGNFPLDIVTAAKESFEVTYTNRDGWEEGYYDAEGLLAGVVTVKVYGLHLNDGKYYWTGDTKVVEMTLNITIGA